MRRLLVPILLVALLPPVLAQEDEGVPGGESIVIPSKPGGLDMTDLAAVTERLRQRREEKAEVERTQPDDSERLRVLNTRIAILERHEEFLRAREAARAARAAEEERHQVDLETLSKAEESVDTLLGHLEGESPEAIRKELETQTGSVREAREAARLAEERLRDRRAERERIPAQREAAEQRRKDAIEALIRLREKEEELRSREAFPEKEFNLVRSEIEARQQEARHAEMRLEFLDERAEYLEGAIERAEVLNDAAAAARARAEAREAAVRAVLDERIEEQNQTVQDSIEDLKEDLEAATEESRRRELRAEIGTLELQVEKGELEQRASSLKARRLELEKTKSAEEATLEEYRTRYAPDAAESDRPGNDTVSAEIRRLSEATARASYFPELDRLRKTLEGDQDRLETLRERLDTLRERLPGNSLEGERKDRRELVASMISTLAGTAETDGIVEDLESSIALRRKIDETRRQTLLLLQRENLFLRGKSHLTWKSVKQGLSDLSALPASGTDAAGGVAAYLVDGENRGGVVATLVLVVLLVLLLLFVRRKILARARREEGASEEDDATVRRARIAILRLLAPLCVAILVLGTFLSPWLLLPEPVPRGVRHLLFLFGLLFSGFWFGRALNRVLVRGRSGAGKVLPFDEASARRLGTGISILLWLTVVLVPLELLLRELGYRNEGALELVSLVYKVLVGIVVLVVLLRRQNLLGFIPESKSRLARFLRVLVTAVHPVLVLLVPGLLLLDVLRYDILAGLIAGVAVNTVAFAVLGYLVYRGLLLLVQRRMEAADVVDPRAPRSVKQDARQVVQFGVFLACLLGTVWAILAFSGASVSELRTFFSVPLPLQEPGAEDPATWWNLFVAVFLLWLTFAVTRYLKMALRVFVLGRTKMDRGLQYTIVTLSGYVLVTGGVVLAVRQLFDLTSFGYVVAALSVGIGFGLQEIVSNFISGIILLFERSLNVGDMIEVGSTEGVVTRIQVRSTTVVTRDNITITIPNRDFMTKNVVNYVGADSKMRLHVPFGVSYSSDPERVREVILAAAKEDSRVLSYPAPEVWFRGFGDSSLDFELLAWIRDPVEQNRIKSALYFRTFAVLGEAGIEIPFPQRDLHIRSSEPLPFHRHEVSGEPPPSPEPEEE